MTLDLASMFRAWVQCTQMLQAMKVEHDVSWDSVVPETWDTDSEEELDLIEARRYDACDLDFARDLPAGVQRCMLGLERKGAYALEK